MRRKTSLSLMELAIMVAVFALAAAICLRAFVWADTNSDRSREVSEATLRAQTAAETIKACHGDFAAAAEALDAGLRDPADGFLIGYDENWVQLDNQLLLERNDRIVYLLGVARDYAAAPGLGKAVVTVTKEAPAAKNSGDSTKTDDLVYFTVAWQEEVTGNE